MPVETAPAESAITTRLLGPRQRRITLIALSVVLGMAIAVLATVLWIDSASDGMTSILIWNLTSRDIERGAVVVALATVAAGLCLVPVSRWWLALLIPVRIAAIGATCFAAFGWLLGSGASATPLLSGGCETGYVVVERAFLLSGSGTVYREEGPLLVTRVAWTSGDDGYLPFADGAYAVEGEEGTLRVWYDVGRSVDDQPVSTAGDPAFTLPVLLAGADATCVTQAAGPQRPPAPTPSLPGPPTEQESRAVVERMTGMSLAAAVGPVLDATGAELDLDAIVPTATECDPGGTRLSAVLDFRTADNSRSLAQILAAWDDAGYEPDRAIGEDIRYSATLPIERMTIRDTTSIDGLIHLRITARCTVG